MIDDVDVAPVEEGRRSADAQRHDPDCGDVRNGVPHRPLVPIPQRPRNGRAPIHGNRAQVPDGSSTTEDVDRQPDVAGDVTERPATQTLVDRRQRENYHRQEEVTDGQVPDEHVGHAAQRPETEYGNYDERVAGCRDGYHERQHGRHQCHFRSAVVEQPGR